MADKINAAGYETKPWWPYVRELMEGGGSVTVEQLNVTENGTYTAESGKAYSPVVVNVEGGSSDFSTTEVTVTNNSGRDVSVYTPIRLENSGMSFAGFQLALDSSKTETVNVILCQDAALCNIDTSGSVNIAATGSIQVIPDTTMCQITGSGTITISDPQ